MDLATMATTVLDQTIDAPSCVKNIQHAFFPRFFFLFESACWICSPTFLFVFEFQTVIRERRIKPDVTPSERRDGKGDDDDVESS